MKLRNVTLRKASKFEERIDSLDKLIWLGPWEKTFKERIKWFLVGKFFSLIVLITLSVVILLILGLFGIDLQGGLKLGPNPI